MYLLAIKQFAKSLRTLDAILGIATAHAKKNNFDPNNFVSMRLFPDMLPFLVQVRIACDNAKSAASGLAGKESPKHEDNEVTMADLRGRIEKCVAYLDTFTAADFAKTTASMAVKVGHPPGKTLPAEEYLFGRQIPNFYFHVTTAYAILRHGGVPLGKGDYLGALNLQDA